MVRRMARAGIDEMMIGPARPERAGRSCRGRDRAVIEIEPGGAVETLKPGERIQFTQGSVNVVDMLGRLIFSLSDAAAEGAQ